MWISVGAISGFLAVGLGAFGAHALKERLSPDLLAIYQTGVQYHAMHALALLGVRLACGRVAERQRCAAGWAFLVGTLIFSGSLYALAITGQRWLGAITPIGGAAFLIGWGLLACGGWSARRTGDSSGQAR